MAGMEYRKRLKQKIYLHQETLFTDNFFNEVGTVSVEKIKAALIQIIRTGTYFRSMPMSVDKTQAADLKDPRLTAFERHEYLKAYSADWEQAVIPVKIANLLNSSLSAQERYAQYRDLMDEVPLFSEIGDLLLLKLVPEKKAADFVIVRLNTTADSQFLTDQFYPSNNVYSIAMQLHNKLNEEKDFIINREYLLASYIDKSGKIISEAELTKSVK